jgi:hypothetical protein
MEKKMSKSAVNVTEIKMTIDEIRVWRTAVKKTKERWSNAQFVENRYGAWYLKPATGRITRKECALCQVSDGMGCDPTSCRTVCIFALSHPHISYCDDVIATASYQHSRRPITRAIGRMERYLDAVEKELNSGGQKGVINDKIC